MGAIGNLDSYMKFKVANAIGDAANNNGGTGSAFNTGAGLALGMMLPQFVNTNQSNATPDSMDKLKKLKELLDMGALSVEEYNEKKKILMNDI